MLFPSSHDTVRMLVDRFFGGSATVSTNADLSRIERWLVQRCFGIASDEPVIAHVRWGARPTYASERLLVTPSFLAWWRRNHSACILPWCEPHNADAAFRSISSVPGPPLVVERFHAAIQLLEPGEPVCNELEARITADPEDLEVRAIYLDWLGEFGHPRAHLNGLDQGDRRFREVLTKYQWDLGPFWPTDGMRTEFRGGFVDALQLRGDSMSLFRMLRHPSFRFLRRLRVVAPGYRVDQHHTTVERMRDRLPLLQDVRIEETEGVPRWPAGPQ